MPSLNHSGGVYWSLIARKKLHADLAAHGLSIDYDDMPAIRHAVAQVLERPLPHTLAEQDEMLRKFSNGEWAPPLHEFDPLKRKPWDVERFRREWKLTLEKLGRRA